MGASIPYPYIVYVYSEDNRRQSWLQNNLYDAESRAVLKTIGKVPCLPS